MTSPRSADISGDSTVDLDLAVIGNCAFAALIDRWARVVWCCLPRLDGDPVFNALLQGRDPGSEDCPGLFETALEGAATSVQRYVPNTAIVVTEIEDARSNAIEVVDFAPRFNRFGRRFRPATIIRRIRPLKGRPRIRIRCRPTFDEGATTPVVTRGSNHVRYVGSNMVLRLTTNAPLSYVADETWFHLERPLTFWLGPDETLQNALDITAEEFQHETADYWREWVRTLTIPFEWQHEVIRAAVTLKLCWFEETGAIVAALTTSIPEAPGTPRNWDYRYCWLRDAFYVVQALNRLGAVDIMESYLVYLRNLPGVSGGEPLQPVYGIGLQRSLIEREAAALPGYRGMGPVRVGNQAYEHRQNDVFGQIILSATQAFFDARLLAPAGVELFTQLEAVGERAFLAHDQPDASLWELRSRARVHTYSMAMCWAACDRLALIAAHLGMDGRARAWRRRADAVKAKLNRDCWNEEMKSFVTAVSSTEVDASLLQLFEMDVAEDAPARLTGTLAQIERRLLQGGHVFRYAEQDDFGLPQTAFNICTFWYIDALYRSGRADDARAVYQEILLRRNHVGLLSEDIDVTTGRLWGNFPQTYSQVGIINSAMRLSKGWRDAI